jgi:glucosyl-dolichyl phosphate glucuronosyltransferase
MTHPTVSIIICSANRHASLLQTLTAFRTVTIPTGWDVELLVVDNGTDDAQDTVRQGQWPAAPTRYVREPRPGKAHALNTGIAAARGDFLLFTDDDVLPAGDWIEKLTAPLLAGDADAVGGRILLAPHLERPWLTERNKRWLAWCEVPDPDYPDELIGANMGLRRSVLQHVPAFDPELGPGAAGLGEDTLFSWQLGRAGLRIAFVPDAVVVHSPDESRLRRAAWLGMARSHGRKDAYILHHWRHQSVGALTARILWLQFKLAVRRVLSPQPPLNGEGCASWEVSYVGDIEKYRSYRRHRRRPPNYVPHGLVRLDTSPPTVSS